MEQDNKKDLPTYAEHAHSQRREEPSRGHLDYTNTHNYTSLSLVTYVTAQEEASCSLYSACRSYMAVTEHWIYSRENQVWGGVRVNIG